MGRLHPSRRTPASGPSRPRAPCIPQHRRHRVPWAPVLVSLPTWHCSRSSRSSTRTPPAGQQSCHGTGPLAGRGPGHRPKGVADPPPCGRPRRPPRFFLIIGPRRPGTPGRSLGASQRKAPGPTASSHRRRSRVSVAMLLMMWLESSRCFPVRMPSAWMIRSVVSWRQQATVVLHQANSEVVEQSSGAGGPSSMSSRRAWCQSRLNSSCSRASWSVEHLQEHRWMPRDVYSRPTGTRFPRVSTPRQGERGQPSSATGKGALRNKARWNNIGDWENPWTGSQILSNESCSRSLSASELPELIEWPGHHGGGHPKLLERYRGGGESSSSANKSSNSLEPNSLVSSTRN